jgi:hypothetical protein
MMHLYRIKKGALTQKMTQVKKAAVELPSPQVVASAEVEVVHSIHKLAKSTGTAPALAEWPTVLVVLNSRRHSPVLSSPRPNQKVSTASRNSKQCKLASELIQRSTRTVRSVFVKWSPLPDQLLEIMDDDDDEPINSENPEGLPPVTDSTETIANDASVPEPTSKKPQLH